MKIVFLGDSLTAGHFAGSYINALREQFPDHEIINAGVGGNTVLNLLARVEDDVLTHEPDGVFVMVGGNDAVSYTQPKTRSYYKQVQNVPDGVVTPELFGQTYRDLIHELQLAFLPTWVGLPPAEYNIDVVRAQRQFNAIAADVARSATVPVLDLMSHFVPDDDQLPQRGPIDIGFINEIGKRASSGWSDYEAEQKRLGYHYTFDGLHLVPASAVKMARIIGEFLEL